jgi:glycosyltransferase involved in cell wall biosynthesis
MKISIVTPSFNQGQFLERTLRSVMEQCGPDVEHIVFDGGSTDNSIDLLKKYSAHLAHWTSEPDQGQTHAVNKGLRAATGDISITRAPLKRCTGTSKPIPAAISSMAGRITSTRMIR